MALRAGVAMIQKPDHLCGAPHPTRRARTRRPRRQDV